MSSAWDVGALTCRIRGYLADNPEIVVLTVPMVQRRIGGAVYLPPHVVEQAFDRLNKAGELSKAYNLRGHCCGDCRAAHYTVLKRTPAKQRAKQRLRRARQAQ